MQRNEAPLLFAAIRANAVFSSVCGALMALGSAWVAGWLGITANWVLVALGAGLLLFALRLYLIGRAGEIDRAEAWTIIGGDLAWVAFSAAMLLGYAMSFSSTGRWLIGGTALVVLTFALLQWQGLRNASRSGVAAADAG